MLISEQPERRNVGEKRGGMCQKRSCCGRGVASKCKRTCEHTCEETCNERYWQAACMMQPLREIGGKRINLKSDHRTPRDDTLPTKASPGPPGAAADPP